MNDSYKQIIQQHIKDKINEWIDQLKTEHPELLLTKQWQLIFPRGFKPGQNVIPVVTGSKNGKHHIADVLFVLPESLQLELDAIELELKNQPFKPPEVSSNHPPPLSDSIDVLSRIISNVNQFLQSIHLPTPTSSHLDFPHLESPPADRPVQKVPIKVRQSDRQTASYSIEDIKKQMLLSNELPEWFQTIDSRDIREQLLINMAKTFLQYREQGYSLSLSEFFEHYTRQLKQQNRLYPYCRYKAKPVLLDENEHCLENYCSKKPYQAPCPYSTIKFGFPPEN